MNKIKLPDIGEGILQVTITDVLVSANQAIKKNDIIIIVESEKASMEIPSTSDGDISEIKINKGDTIKPGDTLLVLDSKKIKNKKQKKETTIEKKQDKKMKDPEKEIGDSSKASVNKTENIAGASTSNEETKGITLSIAF